MSRQVNVYDKASYHLDGDFPAELPERQGYLHAGMFFSWLVSRDLINEDIKENFSDEIGRFRAGDLSPAELFDYVGGVLADDMLTEEGNRFVSDYYGRYMTDYETVLGHGLPTSYHVEDTRQNYEKMSRHIDAAFEKWRKTRR